MQNVLKKLYVVTFVIVLLAPFLLAHREENRIAESENRYYANVPKFRNEEGKVNTNYIQDFEAWINDNVRFRSLFREIKVSVLYRFFDYLDLENVRVGINGDLYASAMSDVDTVQGRNLLGQAENERYEDIIYQLQEWLAEKNIDFYYMQCYDKMTVLNEYYPRGVVQYDTHYIGEDTERYIVDKNRVNIVPLYDLMKSTAKTQNIYYKYVDWCHWNDAGLYLGYEKLMKEIMQKHPKLDYLTMNDYDIVYNDSFRDVYGFQYPLVENVPIYHIKESKAEEKECELYSRLNIKEHTHYYENSIGSMRILLINDSFIRMRMKDYLAESFEECLTVDLTNVSNIEWILEDYQPDIVVLECLETNIPKVKVMLEGLEVIK